MGCSLRPLCVTFTCQLGSASVGDQVEKRLVNTRVVGELGMEGCGHDLSLAHGDGIFIFALGGDDFYVLPYALDFWCADENHLGGRTGEDACADGAVDLASIGVAANRDVERAKADLLGIVDFVRE